MPSSASTTVSARFRTACSKLKWGTKIHFWNSRWEVQWEMALFFLVKDTILTKTLREENKRNRIRVLLCSLWLSFQARNRRDFCTKVGVQSLQPWHPPTMHVYEAIGLNTHTHSERAQVTPPIHWKIPPWGSEATSHQGPQRFRKPQIGGRDSLLMQLHCVHQEEGA